MSPWVIYADVQTPKSIACILYIIVQDEVKFIFQIGLFSNYFAGNEMIGCVKESNTYIKAAEGVCSPSHKYNCLLFKWN